jgi:DNA-directed RNA polymerase subunit RPC12/RpoP
MSRQTRQYALLGAALAGFALAATLFLWNSNTSRGDQADIRCTALCAGCGHYLEATQSELQQWAPPDGTRPAAFPMAGPGYKCPECGEYKLYLNPIVCPNCGTRFLLSPGEFGAAEAICPKCGWQR